LHTYIGLPTGVDAHSYAKVLVLTTAATTTSSASEPQMHYNVGQDILEKVFRGPVLISTLTDSTSQPAAVESSAKPTAGMLTRPGVSRPSPRPRPKASRPRPRPEIKAKVEFNSYGL